MDLVTMEKKLTERQYTQKEEFLDDFDLIVTNCIEYNGKDNGMIKSLYSLPLL